MVSLDFTQSTNQTQGAAQDYYAGTITCGVMTPKNKGTAEAAKIAESIIDGLTSVNSSTYTDTFSVCSSCFSDSWTNFSNHRKERVTFYL